MDQAAPSGANRRRGWRRWTRWLLVLCALPPGAFALSTLWLASPWGCRWIATKIQQRSGLETHLDGASWSPWNGVTLREIVIYQPPGLRSAIAEPLLRIASLRIEPAWRLCLHGQFAARVATADAPRVVLSVQMMSHLAKQAPVAPAPVLAAQAPTPAIAAIQQPGHESPPQATPSPVQPTPSQPVVPPAPVPAVPPVVPPIAAVQTDQPSPAKVATPPAPATPTAQEQPPRLQPPPVSNDSQATAWIHLHHASFQLVSVGSPQPLVEIADLTVDLPVSGDAAASSLSVASLKAWGNPLLTDFQAPLAWQAPVLSLEPVEAMLAGLHCRVAGKLALLTGLPMQLEVQLPQQSPAPLAVPGGGEAKVQQLAAIGRFRGLLLTPATWQGDGFAQGSTIAIHAGAHQAAFDNVSCLVALRGGVLSCVDARFVGDDLSLLGNATLFADGRAAGVLRVVAAPETTLGIVRGFFPKNTSTPSLTSMSTPQRVACDLEVFGVVNDLSIRLGHDGPVMPMP